MYQDAIAEFMAKVEKSSYCWEWTAQKGRGYGLFQFRIDGKKRKITAHRVSFMIFRGEIPEGLQVLHHCDNPGCVNPDHLFLGTQSDNMRDMVSKGRQRGGCAAIGNANINARLTTEQVIEIRRKKENGVSQAELSRQYQVSEHTISQIVRRITWKHI